MDKEIISKVKELQEDVLKILREKISGPRIIIGEAKNPKVTEATLLSAREALDELITLVDAKFIEFLDDLGRKSNGKK